MTVIQAGKNPIAANLFARDTFIDFCLVTVKVLNSYEETLKRRAL